MRYHNATVPPSPNMIVGLSTRPEKAGEIFVTKTFSLSTFVPGSIAAKDSDSLTRSTPVSTIKASAMTDERGERRTPIMISSDQSGRHLVHPNGKIHWKIKGNWRGSGHRSRTSQKGKSSPHI